MTAAKARTLPHFPVTPELIAELRQDEGFRANAYPDPLSPLAKWLRAEPGRKLSDPDRPKGLSGDPWTIGYGHTGPEVCEGLTWTAEHARDVLAQDIADHNAQLARALPWLAKLDPVRLRAVCNMAFNLGVPKLLLFRNTLAAVDRGEWEKAAQGILNSAYAKQVGQRAVRVAHMMRTGERAGGYRL